MISVYLECDPSELDTLVAELHDRGTRGVIELASGVRAWFDSAAGLDDLVRRYDGEIQNEHNEDWVHRTQDSFPAIPVGRRFWLAPPWNRDPAPGNRIRLEINPGLACGTGWHPCTQLCLEALERYVRPDSAVLDVGTGSGILTVAAKLLGAGRTIACDRDADAAAAARERLGESIVFAGSADAVRSGAFDIVVANISAPIIDAILPDLHRVARAEGVLILSGFENPPSIDKDIVESLERDEWKCLICRAGRG